MKVAAMPQRPLPRSESDALVHDVTEGMPRLLEIMARLRAPDGCPWDIEQTFATIAPYTLEEAHEVADAIEREAWDELKGELGDLLFQSVFHAQMAEDMGLFRFEDVVRAISDKPGSTTPVEYAAFETAAAEHCAAIVARMVSRLGE